MKNNPFSGLLSVRKSHFLQEIRGNLITLFVYFLKPKLSSVLQLFGVFNITFRRLRKAEESL